MKSIIDAERFLFFFIFFLEFFCPHRRFRAVYIKYARNLKEFCFAQVRFRMRFITRMNFFTEIENIHIYQHNMRNHFPKRPYHIIDFSCVLISFLSPYQLIIRITISSFFISLSLRVLSVPHEFIAFYQFITVITTISHLITFIIFVGVFQTSSSI